MRLTTSAAIGVLIALQERARSGEGQWIQSSLLAAQIALLAVSHLAGAGRLDMAADTESALDPAWASYLQTEDGEPVSDEATPTFLEAA